MQFTKQNKQTKMQFTKQNKQTKMYLFWLELELCSDWIVDLEEFSEDLKPGNSTVRIYLKSFFSFSLEAGCHNAICHWNYYHHPIAVLEINFFCLVKHPELPLGNSHKHQTSL